MDRIFLLQNNLSQSVSGRDYLLTAGLQERWDVRVNVGEIIRFVVFAFVGFLFRNTMLRRSVVYWVGVSILLSGIIAGNIQIILGKTIQPTHFSFFAREGFLLLNISLIIFFVNKYVNVRKINRKLIYCALLLSLLYGFFWQVRAWNLVASRSLLSDDTMELMGFLRNDQDIKVILTRNIDLESNILFNLSKYSYLPWAQLSTVEPEERTARAITAWRLLEDSERVNFGEFISARSLQLFHLKYGNSDDYSSSLWFQETTHSQIIDFVNKGVLPSEEKVLFEKLLASSIPKFRLDVIIFSKKDAVPACLKDKSEVVFQNSEYIVYHPLKFC